MTDVGFNVHTPAGRAITHLLEKSALAYLTTSGDHLLAVAEHPGGGRTLSIHPTLEAYCSSGEASLLVAVESLAGTGQRVDLALALNALDESNARVLGEAILIAGGFTGHTLRVLEVPA